MAHLTPRGITSLLKRHGPIWPPLVLSSRPVPVPGLQCSGWEWITRLPQPGLAALSICMVS